MSRKLEWTAAGNHSSTGVFLAALIIACCITDPAAAKDSTCYGSVAKGRLENGVQLPNEGRNFTAYSPLASRLGRTHVHSRVADIVLAAYRALENSAPGTAYVFGETGWPGGGRIKPHRTHQNGLSVDFMVPVRDSSGRSVPLPTGPGNKFGYGIEFDHRGRYGDYGIDFEALAEHLYQLDKTARGDGAGIAQVIFDPPFLPRLFTTRRGPYLKANIRFMQRPAWIRHDEHYHVDLSVPCKPSKA